jgi:hypothetical protein
LITAGSVFAANKSIGKNAPFDTKLSDIIPQASLKNIAETEAEANDERISRAINRKSGVTALDENGDIVYKNAPTESLEESNLTPLYDNIFQVYGINSSNLGEDYAAAGSFQDLISNDFSLNIPVADGNGDITSAVELRKIRSLSSSKLAAIENIEERSRAETYAANNAGNYKISIIGRYMPLAAIEVFSDKNQIANILEDFALDDIEEVKLVSLPDYGTELIYILAGEGIEYGIPYGFRSDLTNLENGELYSISEMISILNQE